MSLGRPGLQRTPESWQRGSSDDDISYGNGVVFKQPDKESVIVVVVVGSTLNVVV